MARFHQFLPVWIYYVLALNNGNNNNNNNNNNNKALSIIRKKQCVLKFIIKTWLECRIKTK